MRTVTHDQSQTNFSSILLGFVPLFSIYRLLQEVIGAKAAGLRSDALSPAKQQLQEDLPGIGRAALEMFGGKAYYDEGDSDGDGITDSGGDLMDSPRDDRSRQAREKDREHITTRKLGELQRQKVAMLELEAVHREGVNIDWGTNERTYDDYGLKGPFYYLELTKELAAQFKSNSMRHKDEL